MKTCFKCKKEKPTEAFYKHKQMGDGYLGKCKSCTKKDAALRYADPISRKRIIEYEKLRFQNPERKKKVLQYQILMRKRYPGKYKARMKVSNAIRAGTLVKGLCEFCSSPNTQAHHSDYRKPLNVKWVCRKHHLELENKVAF